MLALLRCQRDRHVWVYSGEGTKRTAICPKCGTSVTINLRRVEILWNLKTNNVQTDRYGGKSAPFVDVWNARYTMIFIVWSDDGTGEKIIELTPSETGISQQEIIESLAKAGVSEGSSGRYTLPQDLKERLRLKMETG